MFKLKSLQFSAVLFLALVVSCSLTGSEEKPQAPDSIAVAEYMGDEEKPVTLFAGYTLLRESVLKNVDDKTAVILIYNGTGRDLNYFQLDLAAPAIGRWAGTRGQYVGINVTSFHGLGPLLKGEKRVIKVSDRAPFSTIRLVFSDVSNRMWSISSARFVQNFNGGVPYLFTLKKDDKGRGIATFSKW